MLIYVEKLSDKEYVVKLGVDDPQRDYMIAIFSRLAAAKAYAQKSDLYKPWMNLINAAHVQ